MNSCAKHSKRGSCGCGIYDGGGPRMLENGNAVLVQLESRRLFWSILAGAFVTHACDPLGRPDVAQGDVGWWAFLCQRRREAPCVPAARTFMLAETVTAV